MRTLGDARRKSQTEAPKEEQAPAETQQDTQTQQEDTFDESVVIS
jgi:hypothetical protein